MLPTKNFLLHLKPRKIRPMMSNLNMTPENKIIRGRFFQIISLLTTSKSLLLAQETRPSFTSAYKYIKSSSRNFYHKYIITKDNQSKSFTVQQKRETCTRQLCFVMN